MCHYQYQVSYGYNLAKTSEGFCFSRLLLCESTVCRCFMSVNAWEMVDMKRDVEVSGQECLDSMPNLIRSGPARSVMLECEHV